MHHHVFIPGLFSPLALWQRDFAFQPESASLLRLLADYQQQTLPVSGVERSLLHWLGLDVSEQLPWAALRHQFEAGGMYQPPLLCADPVHLQSGSDAVVLHADSPALQRDECELVLTDLNQHLAQDGLVLKAFHPQRWYLHALDERFATALPLTTPLSEVGVGNIFPHLPRSSDKYWHQLMNELQMLLHNHPVNRARESGGQRTVNGVWFWGEGSANALTSNAVPTSTPHPQPFPHKGGKGAMTFATSSCGGKDRGLWEKQAKPPAVTVVQGGAVTGQVIASATNARWQQAVDTNPASLPESGAVLVILDQLQPAIAAEQPQSWQQALAGLDDYFVFLHRILQAGHGVTLYDTAGKVLDCQRSAGWQFWRRKRASWQEFIV